MTTLCVQYLVFNIIAMFFSTYTIVIANIIKHNISFVEISCRTADWNHLNDARKIHHIKTHRNRKIKSLNNTPQHLGWYSIHILWRSANSQRNYLHHFSSHFGCPFFARLFSIQIYAYATCDDLEFCFFCDLILFGCCAFSIGEEIEIVSFYSMMLKCDTIQYIWLYIVVLIDCTIFSYFCRFELVYFVELNQSITFTIIIKA